MNTRKSKYIPILPSRATVEGLDRAPHRAFLRGLGLSDNDLKRPFGGVASTDGRVTPCNGVLAALAKDAFAGCDNPLPGMMMAMVRLNLPSVFMYGGAALPGRLHGKDVTVLDTYEAVGGVYAGTVTRKELDVLEHVCLPGLGACPGQFSANTMAMVSETLGLAL